jgi:hypothetical protein
MIGALIFGALGAFVYGLGDSEKGQVVEGAAFGGILGIVYGGIVGAIVGTATRKTRSRLVFWTMVGAIPTGMLQGVVYGTINFRSRPGGRTLGEIVADASGGAIIGIMLGGVLAAGLYTLLREH